MSDEEAIDPVLKATLDALVRSAEEEIGKPVLLTMQLMEIQVNTGPSSIPPYVVLHFRMAVKGGRVLEERNIKLDLGQTLNVTGMKFEGGK